MLVRLLEVEDINDTLLLKIDKVHVSISQVLLHLVETACQVAFWSILCCLLELGITGYFEIDLFSFRGRFSLDR